MEIGIKGKRALITGGSHGIGKAIALALAAEGCHVAVCSRDRKKLAAMEKSLAIHDIDILTIQCDVQRKNDISRTISHIQKSWKYIDILVNNVGGGGRWGDATFEQTDPRVWQEVYEKNAGAAIRFTMPLIPAMKKRKWGRIITISSILGKEGGGRPWFTIAKSAEISLMKTLAMHPDYARSGITFNTVAPGSIMIPGTGWEREKDKNPKKFKKMITDKFPMGRLGTPEEVASVVTFLCSEQASLVNGACVAVDGAESRSF